MNTKRLVHFESHPVGPTDVGRGTLLVFSGYHVNRSSGLSRLTIDYCGERFKIKYLNERRIDLQGQLPDSDDERQLFVGFWGVLPLYPRSHPAPDSELIYHAHFFDGTSESGSLGTLEITTGKRDLSTKEPYSQQREPTLAICMATYRPDRESFKRQINSIKSQTYKNWFCIISDDGSGEGYHSIYSELCGDDSRFKVHLFSDNLGFYYNFERCLNSLEKRVDYIALSDQDDFWYPEKLERLVGAMDQDTSLVYSDMKIVDQSGACISKTYWQSRRNNFQRLDVLMSANTVTGAASLIRADLLEKVLPFPDKIGDAFHDHWIAIVAMSQGKLKYIDTPLYDYYQHAGNIIGHVDFDRSKSIAGRLVTALTRGSALFLRFIEKPSKISRLKRIYLDIRAFFYEIAINQSRSLELMSETIRLRDDRIKPIGRLSPIDSYGRGVVSTVKLLKSFFIAKLQGFTTANRDLYMAIGYLVYSVDPVKWGYYIKQQLIRLKQTRNHQ